MGVDLSNKINMKMFSEATSSAFEGISLLCKNRDGISLELKENQSMRDQFPRNKNNHSETNAMSTIDCSKKSHKEPSDAQNVPVLLEGSNSSGPGKM